MNAKMAFMTATVLAGVLVVIFSSMQVAQAGEAAKRSIVLYTDTFFQEDCDFTSTGANRFFILEPGYQQTLVGEVDGEEVELVITVLDETKVVEGVETRVVEERESADNMQVEVSRNYFAICQQTNSVFYFGEDVDNYEDGEISDHDGSWLAGQDGARAGLIMPGTVLIGSRYMQEIAPDVAMDRAQVISMDNTVETPAGTFENVLKTRESTPLEKGYELKYYARGIGLIQDADLKLKEYGLVDE
ncbi:MAG: hypothetical protein ACREAY_04250 [Nitrososphaera sp.]|uniref:hypothetical protein n=1 Tax=Nitrososphaera sp. TaxID=1971748 RepID=UPI003D6F8422